LSTSSTSNEISDGLDPFARKMVVNGILSCSTTIEKRTGIFGLLQTEKVRDYFHYSELNASAIALGFLEKQIIDCVIKHPQRSQSLQY
jgi:hypothetical protein